MVAPTTVYGLFRARGGFIRGEGDVENVPYLSDDGTSLVAGDREFLVVSSDPPNDADGRANGTIYIQTA